MSDPGPRPTQPTDREGHAFLTSPGFSTALGTRVTHGYLALEWWAGAPTGQGPHTHPCPEQPQDLPPAHTGFPLPKAQQQMGHVTTHARRASPAWCRASRRQRGLLGVAGRGGSEAGIGTSSGDGAATVDKLLVPSSPSEMLRAAGGLQRPPRREQRPSAHRAEGRQEWEAPLSEKGTVSPAEGAVESETAQLAPARPGWNSLRQPPTAHRCTHDASLRRRKCQFPLRQPA